MYEVGSQGLKNLLKLGSGGLLKTFLFDFCYFVDVGTVEPGAISAGRHFRARRYLPSMPATAIPHTAHAITLLSIPNTNTITNTMYKKNIYSNFTNVYEFVITLVGQLNRGPVECLSYQP